jgi:hypothetical protein
MAETSTRLKELSEASALAKKQGPYRKSLSLSEDRKFSIPFSGVSMKNTFAERKAASDKLENLREEETEALQKRQAQKETEKISGMKKGGMTASKRADGIAIRGKTRA